MTFTDGIAELEGQVATYLDKGYAEAAGMDEADFRATARSLRDLVSGRQWAAPTNDRVPFVLVPAPVPAERWIELTDLGGRPGVLQRHFPDVARFEPIESLPVPGSWPYLLVDVDRGAEYCAVRPDDSLAAITARARTPLTIAEGLALLTVFPGTLEKNRCFSLAGSRCGDKRVPALWISQKAPTLGWCWAGNPHTWLGTAHAGGRESEG
jgi:hypothetical protein